MSTAAIRHAMRQQVEVRKSSLLGLCEEACQGARGGKSGARPWTLGEVTELFRACGDARVTHQRFSEHVRSTMLRTSPERLGPVQLTSLVNTYHKLAQTREVIQWAHVLFLVTKLHEPQNRWNPPAAGSDLTDAQLAGAGSRQPPPENHTTGFADSGDHEEPDDFPPDSACVEASHRDPAGNGDHEEPGDFPPVSACFEASLRDGDHEEPVNFPPDSASVDVSLSDPPAPAGPADSPGVEERGGGCVPDPGRLAPGDASFPSVAPLGAIADALKARLAAGGAHDQGAADVLRYLVRAVSRRPELYEPHQHVQLADCLAAHGPNCLPPESGLAALAQWYADSGVAYLFTANEALSVLAALEACGVPHATPRLAGCLDTPGASLSALTHAAALAFRSPADLPPLLRPARQSHPAGALRRLLARIERAIPRHAEAGGGHSRFAPFALVSVTVAAAAIRVMKSGKSPRGGGALISPAGVVLVADSCLRLARECREMGGTPAISDAVSLAKSLRTLRAAAPPSAPVFRALGAEGAFIMRVGVAPFFEEAALRGLPAALRVFGADFVSVHAGSPAAVRSKLRVVCLHAMTEAVQRHMGPAGAATVRREHVAPNAHHGVTGASGIQTVEQAGVHSLSAVDGCETGEETDEADTCLRVIRHALAVLEELCAEAPDGSSEASPPKAPPISFSRAFTAAARAGVVVGPNTVRHVCAKGPEDVEAAASILRYYASKPSGEEGALCAPGSESGVPLDCKLVAQAVRARDQSVGGVSPHLALKIATSLAKLASRAPRLLSSPGAAAGAAAVARRLLRTLVAARGDARALPAAALLLESLPAVFEADDALVSATAKLVLGHARFLPVSSLLSVARVLWRIPPHEPPGGCPDLSMGLDVPGLERALYHRLAPAAGGAIREQASVRQCREFLRALAEAPGIGGSGEAAQVRLLAAVADRVLLKKAEVSPATAASLLSSVAKLQAPRVLVSDLVRMVAPQPGGGLPLAPGAVVAACHALFLLRSHPTMAASLALAYAPALPPEAICGVLRSCAALLVATPVLWKSLGSRLQPDLPAASPACLHNLILAVTASRLAHPSFLTAIHQRLSQLHREGHTDGTQVSSLPPAVRATFLQFFETRPPLADE
eukprot:gene7131-10992_t